MMATYYKWRKSSVAYDEVEQYSSGLATQLPNMTEGKHRLLLKNKKPDIIFNPPDGGETYVYDWSSYDAAYEFDKRSYSHMNGIDVDGKWVEFESVFTWSRSAMQGKGKSIIEHNIVDTLIVYALNDVSHVVNGIKAGDFIGYVYDTLSNAYPNGDKKGEYYYDQRTTITSPTAPTNIQYPNPIITSSATVSWTASVTNVPIYAVSTYEVSYSTNGGSTWTVAGTTADTSLSVAFPAGATSIQFRVRAQDSNGQWNSYATGTASNILLSPTLTVPSMAMQGQQITVNWTSITGATSYTLQRKANTDQDWVQVYSGNALTFTETVGAWTTVQYQVQAVFSVGPGGWGTSKVIPVVSASALVISGQDEDLGLITHNVPYTVSTDTDNPISLTRTVNGVQVASMTVENGFAYDIPVMDLPTGEGTIVISASVNTSGGSPVTATRTWTYTKTAFSFPNTGSTAQLQQEGKNVFPATLAECVRVGANLGGDLGHALEMIAPSILNGARVEVGSYVGTGTYGADNPNTLTFPFRPKMWSVVGTTRPDTDYYASLSNVCFLPWGLDGNARFYGSGSITATISYEDNTVEFYSSNDSAQLNVSGWTYYYVALG